MRAVVRIAAAGAAARKLRLVLTGLAVLFGVAFVAGSFIFTDSITRAFDELFTGAAQGVDVHVRDRDANPEAQQASSAGTPGGGEADTRVPAALLEQVRSIPGVKAAEGVVQGSAQLVDRAGDLVGGKGPPTLGFNWSEQAGLASVTVVDGRGPRAAGEVAVDMDAARDAGVRVGDDVTVVFGAGKRHERFRLVGTVRFGPNNALQGATLSFFHTPTAQRVFESPGRFDDISVQARTGVSARQLRDRIDARLPGTYEVITSEQSTREQLAEIGEFLSFLTYAMLGFASIALFVAAFIIFNTFTITVAQRQVELGMLRAVGASRRQVIGLVLLESAIIGVAASAVGIVAGIGVAHGVRTLMDALGFTMPSGELTLETRTVVVGLGVGIVVTLLAAVIPAVRAARITPVDAIRGTSSVVPSRRRRVLRGVLGVLPLVAGVGLVAGGLLGGEGVTATLAQLGGGFALVVIGVTLTGQVLVGPAARVLGWPMRRRVTGRLAVGNARRNPRRTMTTAAALMIGLGLASFAAIFAESARYSFGRQIERALGADLTISNEGAQGGPAFLGREVARDVAKVRGVDHALGVRTNYIDVKGTYAGDLAAVQDDRIDDAFRLQYVDGSADRLGPREMIVAEQFARKHRLQEGDRLRLEFAGGTARTMRVAGVFRDIGLTDVFVAERTYRDVFPPGQQADTFIFVAIEDGAQGREVRRRVERELRSVPYAQVQDASELKEQASEALGQFLNLILGLLALSIVIALLGIVNTLALSVFERTREVGLLRAVGMSRRQVRNMVRGESIIVALIGALLGLLLGLALGWCGVYALRDEGLELAVPVGLVVTFLVLGALAGLLAAAFPARRAARLDVLRALSHE